MPAATRSLHLCQIATWFRPRDLSNKKTRPVLGQAPEMGFWELHDHVYICNGQMDILSPRTEALANAIFMKNPFYRLVQADTFVLH